MKVFRSLIQSASCRVWLLTRNMASKHLYIFQHLTLNIFSGNCKKLIFKLIFGTSIWEWRSIYRSFLCAAIIIDRFDQSWSVTVFTSQAKLHWLPKNLHLCQWRGRVIFVVSRVECSHNPFESESSKIFSSWSRVTKTIESVRVISLQIRANVESNKNKYFLCVVLFLNTKMFASNCSEYLSWKEAKKFISSCAS